MKSSRGAATELSHYNLSDNRLRPWALDVGQEQPISVNVLKHTKQGIWFVTHPISKRRGLVLVSTLPHESRDRTLILL
jgi:hypothetical protein